MEYGYIENAGLLHGPPIIENYDPTLYADSFNHGEFLHVKSFPIDHADQFGVSALAFDGQEELLWMGNMGGHMSSYYGLMMQKYTSFQAHMTDEIRHILSWDRYVFSLTADTLYCTSKYGLPCFQHRSPYMTNMQCMLTMAPNVLLMGGHQRLLVALDLETRQELQQVEVDEGGCPLLRESPTFLFCGGTHGKVTLLDRHNLTFVQQLDAHTGTLSDFDVCGNQLITCGFSARNGTLSVDRLLMVYDMRYLKKMAPLQSNIDPIFLRFIPTYTNRICVVSQTGAFQVLEQALLLTHSPIYQLPMVEGAMITSFDLSSSNQVLAFGDSYGYLHMFSANVENPTFNQYSQVTEFVPPFQPHMPPIDFNDEHTPYSAIPTLYPPPTETQLSDWPDHLTKFVYRKPGPLDPEVVRTLRPRNRSPVLYAPRPASLRANQVPYVLNDAHCKNKSQVPVATSDHGDQPDHHIPQRYQKVEIKYSKLGVEDFDFHFYNKTNFAGLETNIPNAYCNAMLQVLYFIEPLRCALMNHICEREFCLTCELGYLFHMLDLQKGKTCQATNFLRAFRTIPEAAAHSLILNDTEETVRRSNTPLLIQNWNRFILCQMDTELADTLSNKSNESQKAVTSNSGKSNEKQDSGSEATAEQTSSKPKEATVIQSLFGYTMLGVLTCCKCGNIMTRSTSAVVTDLTYPEPSTEQPAEKIPFSKIIERSLCMDVNTQTWCSECNGYQPHIQSKTLESLPNVISLNCHLENSNNLEFWKQQEKLVQDEHEPDPDVTTAVSIAPLTRPAPSHPASKKACWFGPLCTKANCKYRHDVQHAEHGDKKTAGPVHRYPPPMMEDEDIGPCWVPLGLTLKLTPDGRVEVDEVNDETQLTAQKAVSPSGVVSYELMASVAYINDAKSGGNLVAHILAGERYHKRKEGVTHKTWYLFNDFAITPIEKFVAVNFEVDWKLPCVLYFARTDLVQQHDIQMVSPITSQVLFINASLVTPRRKTITFVPLDENELPQEGDIVGLDAEFVTLNAEEAELHSDGTRSTIKPSQMSVARVTCIREKGPLKYVPFIDDYISTQEQVVDYLTQFSGIQPGDLDATLSSKHLTTLKSTYLKLRYLISCKVTFVGHGLRKDFRVLNLVVPQDQVVDTVDLFHLPRQRMISLKFLAWLFLGIKIQSCVHDSTEDAVTAIRLYYKYKELCEKGSNHLNEELKRMYETGRNCGWQIPEDDEQGK